MESGKPLVSLVVPVFNEEENVLPFYADVRRLNRLVDKMRRVQGVRDVQLVQKI